MKKYLLTALVLSLYALDAFARGGGGGSGGGGGGGGGFSGGSSSHGVTYNGTSSSPGGFVSFILPFLFLLIPLLVVLYVIRKKKKKIAEVEKAMEISALNDESWKGDSLKSHVRETFLRFQNDWSSFNTDSMREYLSENYFKRMVLELNVLKNEGRKNLMEDVTCGSVNIINAHDNQDNTKDSFIAEIYAGAKDTLLDEVNNEVLYVDRTPFTEQWSFIRVGNEWKLDLIGQATENKFLKENSIEEFASKNGFYYDSDFGWLMMPNKGVIFSKTNFAVSDINNHVIGYFRDKIVEFYTYVPNPRNNISTNYIVAQTVIPKSYKNILIRRKNMLFNVGPWGLRKIKTESNEFDNKFCLWADPSDQATSFELLTPNFMEKIYSLPFELNIEVVGNFIYFYAASRRDINYDKMLEILSWAFDEMER